MVGLKLQEPATRGGRIVGSLQPGDSVQIVGLESADIHEDAPVKAVSENAKEDLGDTRGSEEVSFEGVKLADDQATGLQPGQCVYIHSLEGASGATTNGLEGYCLAFNAVTGRWAVLLADGSSTAIKPDNLRFLAPESQEDGGLRPGVVAHIHSLESAAGVLLNGCECRCLAVNRAAGRWRVLMSDATTKAVRSANLRFVAIEMDDKLSEANRHYTTAICKSPLDADLWRNRAAVHLRMRCPHYAAADAIRALNIDPKCANANLHLGCAFFEMIGYKYAVTYLQKHMQEQHSSIIFRKLSEARLKLAQSPSTTQHMQQQLGRYKSYYAPQRTLRADTTSGDLENLNNTLKAEASLRSVEVRAAPAHGGLGLYTTGKCKKGSVLLVEAPILTICYDPARCLLCAKELTRNCQVCSCGSEKYCSTECKSRAWDLYHRVQCGRVSQGIADLRAQLHKHTQMGLGDIAQSCHPLAALRIAGMVRSNKSYPCDVGALLELKHISRLTDNAEPGLLKEVQHPFKNRYSQWKMIELALDLDDLGYAAFDFEFYDNIWHMLSGNLIGDPATGAALLMRSGTFANHSCDPNVQVVLSPGKVKLQALRSLSAGEQVFISYVDTRLPQQDVHASLRSHYWFTCACRRCTC